MRSDAQQGPVYTTINTQRIAIYPGKFKSILVQKISPDSELLICMVDMPKKIKLWLRFLLLEIYPDSPVYTSVQIRSV